MANNYYKEAIEQIEDALKEAEKVAPGSIIIDNLNNALSCLAETAEVYGIDTGEDEE